MKSLIRLFPVVLLMATVPAGAEDKERTNGGFFTMEKPMYKTTFDEAPGVTFDVPKDMKISKVNNIYQLEPPDHYMFRKVEEQDAKIKDFKSEAQELTKRLALAEEKIKRLENDIASGQAQKSLSSTEQAVPTEKK